MLFELKDRTLALLRVLTSRHETHGGKPVPAVSLSLRLSGPNSLLDALDPDTKDAIFMGEPGQRPIPGVPFVPTKLRCKSIKSWTMPEFEFEGWLLNIFYSVDENTAPFKLGKCLVHKFIVSKALEGGSIELDLVVSTSDCDPTIAGWLWAQQAKSIEIQLFAPTQPDESKPKKSKPPKAPAADSPQQTLDATDAFLGAQPEGQAPH